VLPPNPGEGMVILVWGIKERLSSENPRQERVGCYTHFGARRHTRKN